MLCYSRQITRKLTLALSIVILLALSHKGYSQNDSLAFGDKNWISEGLKGKVYFLPENTSRLPNFDTMKSKGTLYAKKLDIPERSWQTGFPGIENRFEWFAIVYTSSFTVKKPGHYTFELLSDDGSKLFIDGKLIIDNDGTHAVYSKFGDVDLDGSKHSITVQYFQGPRYYIALQLFASLDKNPKEIFPGNNFILSTPGMSSAMCWMLWILGVVLVIFLFIIWQRRRKKGEHHHQFSIF